LKRYRAFCSYVVRWPSIVVTVSFLISFRLDPLRYGSFARNYWRVVSQIGGGGGIVNCGTFNILCVLGNGIGASSIAWSSAFTLSRSTAGASAVGGAQENIPKRKIVAVKNTELIFIKF